MVLNNGVSYINYFHEYIIKGEKIWESYNGKLNKSKVYNGEINTSDSDYFFIKFIEINPDEENEILDFYNTYGDLENWNKEGCIAINGFEKLSDVQFQIRVMKAIVNLKNALDDNDMNSIIKLCSELYSLRNFSNNENNIYLSFEHLMYCNEIDDYDVHFYMALLDEYENLSQIHINAEQIETIIDSTLDALKRNFNGSEINSEYLSIANEIIEGKDQINTISLVSGKLFESIINSYINEITPVLEYNNCKIECNGQWRCPTLLSAMYFELYLAYCNKRIIKKCKNKTCNKYFPIYGNDKRKQYCNNACAKLEWQRNKRERERNKNNK